MAPVEGRPSEMGEFGDGGVRSSWRRSLSRDKTVYPRYASPESKRYVQRMIAQDTGSASIHAACT